MKTSLVVGQTKIILNLDEATLVEELLFQAKLIKSLESHQIQVLDLYRDPAMPGIIIFKIWPISVDSEASFVERIADVMQKFKKTTVRHVISKQIKPTSFEEAPTWASPGGSETVFARAKKEL